MKFLNPEYLWLLLLIPIVYFFYYISSRKRKEAAIKFSNLGLIKLATKEKRWRKNILFYLNIALLLLLVLALADPHIPLKKAKEGVNVVLAIDVSGSMKASDYKPNRMEAAKLSALTLVDSLQLKDNIGIVIFENGATTASYLTQLKDRAKDKLSSIAAKDGRTAIGDGLALAVDMVTSIPNKKKLVILLSDGVNNAGVISPDEAIKFANDNDIQVFTIGMGSEGKVVLGYDFFGRPSYAELDEELLENIATQTGGEYYKAVDDKTLNEIYKSLSDKIKREKEDVSIKDWFIVAAIIVLGIELYIRYGKYRIIQ
jgi:Ca-activated chloride channel family protein